MAKTSAIHTTQAAESRTMKEEGLNEVGRFRKLKMRPNSRNTPKKSQLYLPGKSRGLK